MKNKRNEQKPEVVFMVLFPVEAGLFVADWNVFSSMYIQVYI